MAIRKFLRPPWDSSVHPIGLALGGGAAKGLAHIGVISALEAAGIRIDLISGVSIGAVVGGLYALNPDARALKDQATRLLNSPELSETGLEVFQPDRDLPKFQRFRQSLIEKFSMGSMVLREALVDQAKLTRLFQRIFGEHTFKNLKLPFAPVALDLSSGREVIIKDGKLYEAVMASCAIPGVFPPQRGSGMALVDGGVSDNLAIRTARALGAKVVLSVSLSGPLPPAGALNRGFQIFIRGDQIARAKLQEELLKEADLVINPNLSGLHWADFRKLDYCIEKGEAAVWEKLAEIRTSTSRLHYLRRRLQPRFGPRYFAK